MSSPVTAFFRDAISLGNCNDMEIHDPDDSYVFSVMCSMGMGQQKNSISTYIVELSKPYGLMPGNRSRQNNYVLPRFHDMFVPGQEECVPLNRLPRSSWTFPGYRKRTNCEQKSCSYLTSLFGVVKVK